VTIGRRKLAMLVVAFVLSGFLAERTSTQQAGPAPTPPDGLVRSEVSLMGRTATVAFPPSLAAANASGAAPPVIRLTTNGSLLLGSIALGKDDPAGTSYDLGVRTNGDGWRLDIREGQTFVGEIELSRQASGAASPSLVAALIPATENTAHLLIRWGAHQATTTAQFTDRPRRRLNEQSRPNVTTSRTHDEDTSALSRARLLAQRNETALILPKGRRLSASFARAFTKQERSTALAAASPGLSVDGPDFARLATTPAGSVVLLTESAVPRLRIEAPLRFGRTTVATGNQGPGFPGTYGIWLKRVANGWRMVLNHEPDAWGSQHDPKFDAVEIPLAHTEGPSTSRPFAVSIVPTAADRGRLIVFWGPHEWSADFAAGN
jgi:hypothetical protein